MPLPACCRGWVSYVRLVTNSSRLLVWLIVKLTVMSMVELKLNLFGTVMVSLMSILAVGRARLLDGCMIVMVVHRLCGLVRKRRLALLMLTLTNCRRRVVRLML